MPHSHATAMLPVVPSFRDTSFQPVPRHNAQSSLAMIFLWDAVARCSFAAVAHPQTLRNFWSPSNLRVVLLCHHHTTPRSTPQSFQLRKSVHKNKKRPDCSGRSLTSLHGKLTTMH
jgi:hypothetical protein